MVEKLENRKWKVLESKHIIERDEWLSVRQEKVELPSGVIIPSWYILEFPDWINVIAITEEGKMVMIDQYRHAVGTTNYELVAGVVDKGESPLEAAQRELLEESGYGDGNWIPYMKLSPNPTNHSNTSHTFLATGVKKITNQHTEASEDIRVHILSQEDVFDLLQSGEIIQALHAAPLYKYFCDAKNCK